MPGIPQISIIDDDGAIRCSLENLIRALGLRAQGFSSAESFLSSNEVHETPCLVLEAWIDHKSLKFVIDAGQEVND
jgi:FixJ family two-component response regulator